MSTATQMALKDRSAEDARRTALSYIGEAFALATLDGVEPVAVAEAALCAAMCEFVAAHGEDHAAKIATRLAERTACGEFSVAPRQ